MIDDGKRREKSGLEIPMVLRTSSAMMIPAPAIWKDGILSSDKLFAE